MEIIQNVIKWVSDPVHCAELVALGWCIEKILVIVARWTPWKWDDDLGVILAKILEKIGGKK